MRPPLPADYRAAIVVLIIYYGDTLPPADRQALWRMWGKPALDRLWLAVIARTALDRAEGRRHGR